MIRQTPFTRFEDVEAHLAEVGLFHQDLRLERMYRSLKALELSRPPFPVVQILGTNGKGSTAAFLANLCRTHGYKTGLYTSPHFVSMQERIQIDGQPVLSSLWAAQANRIMAVAPDLTYFEFLTVLALLLFRELDVDVAVLEAGLGGRHDATTAIDADLLCFTPIAMDHMDVLGKSLESIAADKAAAIRGTAPVCTAIQFPQALDILQSACAAQGAPLIQSQPLPTDSTKHWLLRGEHQQGNAGLALCAWRRLAPLLDLPIKDSIRQQEALAHAFVPGRLQFVEKTAYHPALLLDGAHNPHGMRSLTRILEEEDIRPSAVIFSCLGDKDWHAVVQQLKASIGRCPILIPHLNNPRAADNHIVTSFWNSVATGAEAMAVSDTATALMLADASNSTGNPVLVTGSLYLLAEVFALFPHLLTQSGSFCSNQNDRL